MDPPSAPPPAAAIVAPTPLLGAAVTNVGGIGVATGGGAKFS